MPSIRRAAARILAGSGARLFARGISMRSKFCLLVAVSRLCWAVPALAAPGDPVTVAEGVTLDPILAARLRYEMVDQANFPASAGALTIRARAGAELKFSGF